MSDSLNTLAGLAGGSSIGRLLVGQLSLASWRGIPFHMPQVDGVDGHRAVRFRYPGSSRKDFQFLGPLDGPIHVTGLLIGDDCVQQANKLRQANLAAGPGTLVHPWLGTMQAVLMDEGCRVTFSEGEFRLARFEATFERYVDPPPPKPDWFGRLQDSVDGLMNDARTMLAGVMGTLAVPLALYGFASGLLGTASGLWSSLSTGPAGTAVLAAVTVPVAALDDAAPTPDGTFAGAIADLLAAPALAIAAAGTPADAPAVASAGPDAAVADSLPPDAAAAVLLQAAAGLAAGVVVASAPGGAVSAPIGIICLAAQMQAAAQAAAVGATIPFDSADAAIAWRTKLDGTLSGLQQQAGVLAATLPLVAGPAWRALGDFRVTVAADIAARVLDLPGLASITTDRPGNAWRIALAVVGDTPELMTGVVVDLWRRSGVHNPAALPAGTYAYLP